MTPPMAALMRVPVTRNAKRECECGRPKSAGAQSCERCAFLDGSFPRQVAVIEVLRLHPGGLSVGEIAGGKQDDNPSAYRATVRTLLVMLACGRVRRYWRENPRIEREYEARGWGSYGSDGCWVYVLSARSL